MPLDADQIADITRGTVDLYRTAERQLLALVTRHLAAGLDAPGWAESRLAATTAMRRAAARVLDDLAEDTSGRLAQTVAEAYRTGAGAVLTDLPSDVADRLAARAAGETITRTAAMESLSSALVADVGERHSNVLRHVTDVYRRTVAEATAVSIAGGQTRRQAAQHAYQRFLDQGVASFTDVSGRTWRLSSYVEMALRTVTQRAAVQGQTDRQLSLGLNLAIVSNVSQECERCRPYEGKILRLDSGPVGRIEVEHVLTGETITVDVTATLDDARSRGFQHPNCRHAVRSYLPGVTRQPAGPTADPKGDDARQRQRHLERQIRKYKERGLGALDPVAGQAARARVRGWQAKLRQHLDEHPDLKRLPYREQIGAGNIPPKGRLPGAPTPPPATSAPAVGVGVPRPDIVHVSGPSREPILRELGRQATLAPAAETRLAGVHSGGDQFTNSAAMAYYHVFGPRRGHLHMHADWDRDPERMATTVRRSNDSGWFTPSGADPVQSVLAHEYGHHITRTMFDDAGIISQVNGERLLAALRDQLGIDLDTVHHPLNPATTIGTLMPRITTAVQANRDRIRQTVSQYGATNGFELLAEIWQEYSTSGDAARPHIRAIGDVMRDLAVEASR